MKTLSELLQNEKSIWFKVDKKYRKQFLKFAKENGCKWMNGDEIKLKNNISYCMGISSEYRLGFVSLVLLGYGEQTGQRKIYNFKELLGE